MQHNRFNECQSRVLATNAVYPCRAAAAGSSGGTCRYYGCSRKATAGATNCPSKAVREDALDRTVLDGLLGRVLQPERLKVLLADVLDRSNDAEKRRKDDLDRVRRERIAAESRLRRLLDLVEGGLMSLREPILGRHDRHDRGAHL